MAASPSAAPPHGPVLARCNPRCKSRGTALSTTSGTAPSSVDAASTWRDLVDAASDAYISIGADGHVTEWNRRAEALFGWTRDEAVGELLAGLIVPAELRDAHLLGLRRFVATGRGRVVFQRLELPALHRSGRRLQIGFTILPARTPEGAWRFHAFLRDVGAQRRKQSYLRLLQEVTIAANEAPSVESAVRATLDAVRGATGWVIGHAYLAGDDGQFRASGWWSPAPREPFTSETMDRRFAAGVGLPGRVASTGAPAWIRDLGEDDDFPRGGAALAAGLRAGFAFPVTVESRIVGVLELFSEELEDPDRELLEVMEIVGSQVGRVFERHRAMEDLRRAVEDLRRAVEDRQTIVSIVGHELRGPLAATHAATGLLADELRTSGSDEARSVLDILDRQLGRLRRLVDELLTAQRLEAGSLTPRPAEVKVADVAQEVVDDGGFDGVDIDVADDVRAHADLDHVTHILWNLLANATNHGRPPVRVTTAVVGDQLRIQVSDAGDGVPEHLVGRLFDRFARGGDSAGTGLGLAIARGLARANAGDVRYSAEQGRSPAFVVELPTAGRG
jgi:two-component system cell cycle sensor histidine kinase/response regulator CckA